MRTPFSSAIAALALLTACSKDEPARPPDVVVILADDLGWADVGYHGDTGIRTPAIDQLARTGLRLERYCTAPLCTPARAGLLTGRSPLRLGLRRNVLPSDSVGLPLDEELLPAAFFRVGYATAMVGKWHLGHARPDQRPLARGFERFYGFLGGWIDYSTHRGDGGVDWSRGGQPISEQGNATQLLAREAVSILADPGRTRPLFLYVALNAPHPPVHVPPGRSLEQAPAGHPVRRGYVLMVEELDRAVGSILAAIERSPRARETIVFFASDNGADPRYGGSNAPLSRGKWEVFEGGIRVPAVLWWPEHVAPGESSRLVTHQDVLPTIAGLAGVTLDPARPLDGRNAWPALAGGVGEEREPAAFGVEDGEERSFALVGERWKLVEAPAGALGSASTSGGKTSELLFDVAADPGETRDLGREERQRLEAMRAQLEPWKKMPTTLPAVPAMR